MASAMELCLLGDLNAHARTMFRGMFRVDRQPIGNPRSYYIFVPFKYLRLRSLRLKSVGESRKDDRNEVTPGGVMPQHGRAQSDPPSPDQNPCSDGSDTFCGHTNTPGAGMPKKHEGVDRVPPDNTAVCIAVESLQLQGGGFLPEFHDLDGKAKQT